MGPVRGRALLALLAIAAVAVAACSSSSKAAPTSNPTSTSTSPSPTINEGDAGKLPGFPTPSAPPTLPTPSTTPQVQQFISAVFQDAQADWQKAFAGSGLTYRPARLVLFSSAVTSGCGPASSDVGPFYCPADATVYLDVRFFDEMEQRYGVKGDFAQAFVVAHEVGHHIQSITGTSAQVGAVQEANPSAANALSILTELQADCYAGVWAHSTYERGLLEPGDLEEALTAAAAVGDDFLQKATTGSVHPEQWTHGSSAQRQQWLNVGYQSGQPSSCDTFSAAG